MKKILILSLLSTTVLLSQNPLPSGSPIFEVGAVPYREIEYRGVRFPLLEVVKTFNVLEQMRVKDPLALASLVNCSLIAEDGGKGDDPMHPARECSYCGPFGNATLKRLQQYGFARGGGLGGPELFMLNKMVKRVHHSSGKATLILSNPMPGSYCTNLELQVLEPFKKPWGYRLGRAGTGWRDTMVTPEFVLMVQAGWKKLQSQDPSGLDIKSRDAWGAMQEANREYFACLRKERDEDHRQTQEPRFDREPSDPVRYEEYKKLPHHVVSYPSFSILYQLDLMREDKTIHDGVLNVLQPGSIKELDSLN